MASNPSDSIKSGPQIVKEFVESLGDDVDADTLSAIRTLHESGKLTKTRLIQALEQARAPEQPKDASKPKGSAR